MILLVGTVPIRGMPLLEGCAEFKGDHILLNDMNLPCTQGTGAMVGAATTICKYLGSGPPRAIVAGDTGEGIGSLLLYEFLVHRLPEVQPKVLVLHYILPDIGLMKEVVKAAEKCPKKPILLADAGSMYAVKAAGLASKFDLMTPDATELAFLADPEATHPAYISKFFFETEVTSSLIESAYEHKGASRVLLIKGPKDYVVKEGKIVSTISEPNLPELEAIGGTGDTITGMAAAFIHIGMEVEQAAILAAKSNRAAGLLAHPSPGTQVWELIQYFPEVCKENLCAWAGICVT